VRACASGQLPAGRIAPFQCRGDFAEREIEYVVQQEGRSFERTGLRPVLCGDARLTRAEQRFT
jgi:hypothetical protein